MTKTQGLGIRKQYINQEISPRMEEQADLRDRYFLMPKMCTKHRLIKRPSVCLTCAALGLDKGRGSQSQHILWKANAYIKG